MSEKQAGKRFIKQFKCSGRRKKIATENERMRKTRRSGEGVRNE